MPAGARATAVRVAVALCVAILASPVVVDAPVRATHSVPSPLWWWDNDNDGIRDVEEGQRSFQKVGTGWTLAKENHAYEAAWAWRGSTTWQPTVTSATQVATIRVDGVHPCGSWQPGDLAVTCRLATPKYDRFGERYYDIYDADIGFNLGGISWNYESGQPGPGQFDFRGVLTHELGHAVRLRDLYGSACGADPTDPHTMCGEVPPGITTYNQRSLTSDDIDAANFVY
jgi:hypothetical protein